MKGVMLGKGKSVVYFAAVHVKHPQTMSLRGLSYYEQHFLFSNRLVQLVIGLNPEQTSIQILFIFSMIAAYVLPMILHQVKAFLSSSFLFLYFNFYSFLLYLFIYFSIINTNFSIHVNDYYRSYTVILLTL